MREFNTSDNIFIRSNNSSSKILLRYTYILVLFIIFLTGYLLYSSNTSLLIDFIKTLFTVTFIGIVFQYIINITRHKKKISLIFTEDNIISSSIIISLFAFKERLMVGIVAIVISQIVKLFNRNISISSSLYGILFILIYTQYFNNLDTPLINFSNLDYSGTVHDIIFKYGNILSFIFGTNLIYLSPILCIISFIYLFIKKSIKYSVVLSYLSMFILSMMIIGFINGMSIWFLFFQVVTGNILFLTVFALTDYKVSPITYEGGVIYGMIISLISIILRFIVPELSIVIALIIGQLFIVNYINKISYKLKYNHKFYRIIFTSCIVIAIITIIIISLVY